MILCVYYAIGSENEVHSMIIKINCFSAPMGAEALAKPYRPDVRPLGGGGVIFVSTVGEPGRKWGMSVLFEGA